MKISVAVAEEGRQGEVRFLGDVDNRPEVVWRLVSKLGNKYRKVLCCYERRPTGYGLQRQIADLGHDFTVEAAMADLREKRQHLQSFLLRHGRLYPRLRHWSERGHRAADASDARSSQPSN